MDRGEAFLQLLQLIEEQSTLVLARVGADGAPLATPLFYLPERPGGPSLPEIGAGDGPPARWNGEEHGRPPSPPAPEDGARGLPILYWLSSPSSRHSQAISDSAAASVHGCSRSHGDIRGAQLEGRVEVVDDPAERERLLSLYVERFRLGGEHGARIASSTLYRFIPGWIRYLDNRGGSLGRWEFGNPPAARGAD